MNLSIIIPTMNSSGDLLQDKKINRAFTECLTSLLETTKDIPIIVASNGGDAKSLPRVADHRVKRINVWEQGQNKSVNAAAGQTNSEWIMVTNDDMIFPLGWLETWKPHKYDYSSPILIEPQDGAPTFKKVFFGGGGGDFDKQGFLNYAENHKGEGWRTGTNLPFIMHRELWNTIGGYDVKYDPWGSNGDSDLQYKAKLAGVQPMQNSDVCVYHFSQTSGTFHPKRRNYWQKNWDYFIEKWGFERTDKGIWEATYDIPKDKLKYKPTWMKETFVK